MTATIGGFFDDDQARQIPDSIRAEFHKKHEGFFKGISQIFEEMIEAKDFAAYFLMLEGLNKVMQSTRRPLKKAIEEVTGRPIGRDVDGRQKATMNGWETR